jgi:Tat protein secretion system quality control protein TatD with DNase activity
MAGIVAMGIMPTMIFENRSDLFSTDNTLRAEIAAAAASLIAEEGLDYANAKRKAIERIAGKKHHRLQREILPSNEEIEEAVREYQKIFQADSQPLRLRLLREKALALMRLLADFSPMLTGAVANGTASEHSDIHLHCFAPSAKELGIFLMNQGLDSEAASLTPQRPGGDAIEALAIQWQGELATIAVYPEHDQRSSPRHETKRKHNRLDIKSVEKLLRDNPVQETP